MNHKKNNIKKTFKKLLKKYESSKRTNNKTIKKRIKQEDLCKSQESKKYYTFEDKIEKVFKDEKIDFATINDALEKEILNDLKKASSSSSNIRPNDDYYSYINERWLKDYEKKTGNDYLIQYRTYLSTHQCNLPDLKLKYVVLYSE
jgi:uncharacterized membrane protein YheB (UPF0754 family)